jgi:hypothetical protein
MPLSRLTRSLTLVPVVAGTISTLLFLAQGGFGGGHSSFDFVITTLGFPSILLVRSLPLPDSAGIPDILLVIWIPALINLVGFFLLGSLLTKVILVSSKAKTS